MFYIVGLGNPGEQYISTRHNVGWLALDYFCGQASLPSPVESGSLSGRVSEGVIGGKDVTLLYPNTYMNNSGSAVAKLVTKNEASQLLVVHDDIDLPFGEVKVVKGRGSGGNKGVQSVIDKVGSKDFIRIRIGIAPKSFWTGKLKRPASGRPLEQFVLKSFSGSEQKQLPDVFEKAAKALRAVIADGVEVAMNKCN